MDIINRSAFSVYGTQKFVDWINTLDEFKGDDSMTLEEVNANPSIFLVPEYEEDEDGMKFVDEKKEELFQHMLDAWQGEGEIEIDPTEEDFDEWFDLAFTPMICDLDFTPIVKDEIEMVED